MRSLTLAAILGLLVIPPTIAQEKKAEPNAAKVSSSTPSTNAESAKLADEGKKKADELEKARQRRLNKLSKSICVGC
jgi:hypothetical protein